jgi:outer membrane protein assembly factor BamD (BamD/ComL family)
MSKTSASPKTLAAKVRPFTNNAQKEALTVYAGALEAMQSGRYDEALSGFQSLDVTCPPEISERARVYSVACERQLALQQATLEFLSPTEQYDYAIARINNGDYEDAREQLEAILSQHDEVDYAHYGLAMLHSMTGQAEGCLHHLERAIELNPHNRVYARSDVDFRQMADDPRFTELLYPEAM